MADPKNLPPEIVELLKKGDKLGAMKLMLGTSKGGGGLIGKTVIEALEGAARSGQSNVKVVASANLPPDVLAALRSGNKIEAIKLLREHTGLGLADAKGRVDAHEAPHGDSPASSHASGPMATPTRSVGAHTVLPPGYVKRDGLSPGEVQRTNHPLQIAIVFVVIAVAIGLYITLG